MKGAFAPNATKKEVLNVLVDRSVRAWPPSGGNEKARGYLSSPVVHTLFLLNIVLQLFDGLSTYQGVHLGWREGNPLVHALMGHCGVGWALLGAKAAACALLLLLRCLGASSFVTMALRLTAGCYFALSFVPWLSLLLLCLTG